MNIPSLPDLEKVSPLSNAVKHALGCLDSNSIGKLNPDDTPFLWEEIRRCAIAWSEAEPYLRTFLHRTIVSRASLHDAVAARLGRLLGNAELPGDTIEQWAHDAFAADETLNFVASLDLIANTARDPVLNDFTQPILFRKGYLAVQCHRVAHWMWHHNQPIGALFLQARMCDSFGIDIHPAARIGKGLFMDHATGIVIGETTVVGDDCSILQGVTLGGTGKTKGDRHPKLGRCVLVGAGAMVLGNHSIGDCSTVAAGSMVLRDVPPRKIVAGVPAKIVGDNPCAQPALDMQHEITPADDGSGD